MDTARLRRDKSLTEVAQNDIEDESDNDSGSPGEGSQEQQGLERSSESEEDVGNVGTRSRLKRGKYDADLEVKEGGNDDGKERDNSPQCSSGNEESEEDDAGLVRKQRDSVLTQSTSLTRTRAGVRKRAVDHIVVEEGAQNSNEQGGVDGGSGGTMVVEGACAKDEEDSKLTPKLSEKKYREAAAEKKAGIRTSTRCVGDRELASKKSLHGCQAPPEVETREDFSRFKSKKLAKHPLTPNVQKMSLQESTITPKPEETRAVRSNRGIKRRFPGDESDDSVPKCVRVRTIASMCGNTSQPVEDDELSTEEVLLKTVPTKKRGRPRKHVYVEQLSEKEEEEGEKQLPLSSLKRRIMETEGLGSQSSKQACKNGSSTSPLSRRSPLFVCNVEGCKRKFKEEPALYAHARVHGDRAYACHYEGCNKSFSERSKLKRHFLIHTGEKPFLCLFEGCGKAFSLDFNLRSHTKTHTGDYNECPYANCEKRYCQEYKLRAHIAKVHGKSPRGMRKMATLENIQDRSHTQHVKAKTKRTNLLAAITVQSVKLKEAKEGRVHRIAELERQRRREAAELARIEQDLGKLERKQRQLKEGQKDCAVVMSLSLSGGEDGDKGEEMAKSLSTAAHTISSGEEQSRLSNLPGMEYTAMGEGKEVLMVSQELPKTDQGASLVMASSETQLLNSQQPETVVSLTPLLWLQGTPPNQGHLAGQPGAHAYLRTQRPMSMSELRAIQNSAKPIRSSHATSEAANPGNFRMIGNSADQQKRMTGVMLQQGGSSHAGMQPLNATEVRKLEAHRKVGHEATKLKTQTDRELVRCDKGVVQSSASSSKSDKNIQIGVSGKGSIKKLESEDTRTQKQKRTRDCHLSTADQAFVSLTPRLFSTDNRFSPTDARFLAASEALPSAMQRTLWGFQQNKQDEAVKVSFSGRNSVANEVSCSINVVSAYSTQNGGFSAEQSFEPSAAQLFTYHEQPRLVD